MFNADTTISKNVLSASLNKYRQIHYIPKFQFGINVK